MDLVLLGQIQDGETERGGGGGGNWGNKIGVGGQLQNKNEMPSFIEKLVERTHSGGA